MIVLKHPAHELYEILNVERNYHNRDGLRKNNIPFYKVFQKWHRNTQDGVLAKVTAESSFHSMDIYAIPNYGSKPIQEVCIANLHVVLNIYVLMGNTTDWYLNAKFRSLYDHAIGKGYVHDKPAYTLKGDNVPVVVKLVFSDKEIRNILEFAMRHIRCTHSCLQLLFTLVCKYEKPWQWHMNKYTQNSIRSRFRIR